MITSIARQSIIIKCNMKSSTLLGNYEFYYAAGLFRRLFDVQGNADMKPQELMALLQEAIPTLSPKDEREQYLVKLVQSYDPPEDYDEQMKELFIWGEGERDLWQLKTSNHGA